MQHNVLGAQELSNCNEGFFLKKKPISSLYFNYVSNFYNLSHKYLYTHCKIIYFTSEF